MINVNKKEYFSRKYKLQFDEIEFVDDFEEAELCGANIIAQNKDGSCIYLKNKKCSIHASRPASCRNFFCSSKNPQFGGMIEKIKEHKSKSLVMDI